METSLIGKALDFGSNEYGFDPRVSNIRYNSYAYVINHLNLAMSRKKLSIKIKYTKKNLELVKVLHKIGYLNNFSVSTTRDIDSLRSKQSLYIYMSPSFFKNTPFFKSLRLVSTPSKKHFTTLKALSTINKTLKSSVLIISTSNGLIDHKEAMRIKTGGTILCIAS